jgi:integrase
LPLNTNPARLVEFNREVKRERLLTPDEAAALGSALEASRDRESPWTIAAILLLLFTGARRGEILGLEWAAIDLEAGTARLRDSKTGAKTLFLSAAARAVLERLPRRPDNPYVICGEIKGKPLIGLPRAWRRIRKRAGLDDLRLHDLRHAFASAAASRGTPLLTIGKLLGHSQPSVTNRYAHLASAPLVEVADHVAAALEAQIGGAIELSDGRRRGRRS